MDTLSDRHFILHFLIQIKFLLNVYYENILKKHQYCVAVG